MTTTANLGSMRNEDIEATASMLAASFIDDPAYGYLVPATASHSHGLTGFFRGNLRVHLAQRCTYTMKAAGRLVGTVTIRPPGGVRMQPWTLVRHGFAPFILGHENLSEGRAAWRRLMWLKKTYDALEALAADHGLHVHVHMMAIRPDQQGAGLGTKLLEAALRRATAGSGSFPIVLTTHLERNVTFYRRAGFEVISECIVTPPDAEGWTVWSMRRPASGRAEGLDASAPLS